MRLRADDLPGQLAKGLRPVYLIVGDEPLQRGEAADAVRAAARAQDYSDRQVLEQGPGFDWHALAAEADNLSLFAERRILELRLASTRIGTDGSQALCAYVERLPLDTLLLVTGPKLDANQLKSKWVKALDQAGVLIQVWPLQGRQLGQWIERRMRGLGLQPGPDVVGMLAERVEGNLLAAAQEIDKLLLLHGPGPLDAEQLLAAVADSARFDVFGLVDSALQGQAGRCLRMLDGLRAEDVPAPVVLWALAREIRTLARLARVQEQGQPLERAFAELRVWDKRKPLVRQGLQRFGSRQWRCLLRGCARIDRIIKGREPGSDPWEALRRLTAHMAGLPSLGQS